MRNLSHWFKRLILVVAVLGLLTSAWPSVAQGQLPPLTTVAPRLSIEERLQEPDRYLQEMVTPMLQARAAHPASVPVISALPLFAWSASPLAPTTVDDRPWSKITFGSFRDNDWEIYILNGDSTSPARLTVRPGYDSLPKLNRGATRVVFVSDRDGNYEIYVMNVDGSAQTRLTSQAATDTWPAWSPDGSKIAFYSKRDGNYELYVMNADGTNQTRLTNNAAWDGHPEWLPDNSGIIFASNRSGAYEIWKISPDGANPQQISFGARYASFPHYTPRFSLISFSQDANNDGWYDAASVWATGGAPMSSNPPIANRDYIAFIWSPQNSYSAFNIIDYVVYQGQYYWTSAFSMASHQDEWDSYSYLLTDSSFDWWPDWQTADIWSPTSRVSSLPAWTNGQDVSVVWTGADTGPAGVAAYDVQYRDGLAGSWTDWLVNTAQTTANFTGEYGHTYYFRSRAGDFAGNTEPYPTGNGDTLTTVYQYSLTDQVVGNRDQPVAAASIATGPSAINTGLSRHDGLFDLYFASGGIYTLTTTRNAFGVLPPLFNVSVPLSMSLPPLYLPPLDDQLSDGHFENGDLSAWNPSGLLTPTITTTAHTGEYAALLGGIVPSDTISSGPYFSTIEQTITVPLTLTDGTLSLLYEVTAANPLSDTLRAYLIGPTDTLTVTLPITATAWTHQWFDVSAWTAPTATLRIELSTPDKEHEVGVLVDEVTWGSSVIGSRPIYLPIITR